MKGKEIACSIAADVIRSIFCIRFEGFLIKILRYKYLFLRHTVFCFFFFSTFDGGERFSIHCQFLFVGSDDADKAALSKIKVLQNVCDGIFFYVHNHNGVTGGGHIMCYPEYIVITLDR